MKPKVADFKRTIITPICQKHRSVFTIMYAVHTLALTYGHLILVSDVPYQESCTLKAYLLYHYCTLTKAQAIPGTKLTKLSFRVGWSLATIKW